MFETKISSSHKELIIGCGRPTVIVGERINPAGKVKLAEALRAGNLDIIRQEAIAQVQAGADALDICVGTFGVDELVTLPRVVELVMNSVDVPLCLDTTNHLALEATLKIYKGKPLINSVSGEEQSLKMILPLVKEYGAAVIGLVQDENGTPKNAVQRIAIAHKIMEYAAAAGIPAGDVIIDCLATAIGANINSGVEILEAIQMVRNELGVNVILGVSNVSFGLPDRELLNNAFIATAIAAGATSLIVDTSKARLAILAADLVQGRDRHARRYIEAYRLHMFKQTSTR